MSRIQADLRNLMFELRRAASNDDLVKGITGEDWDVVEDFNRELTDVRAFAMVRRLEAAEAQVKRLRVDNIVMRKAHERQFDGSGWCAVCDQHDHADDCPVKNGDEV